MMLSLRRGALALALLALTPSCGDGGSGSGGGGAGTTTSSTSSGGTGGTSTGGGGTGGTATGGGGAGGTGGMATGGTGGGGGGAGGGGTGGMATGGGGAGGGGAGGGGPVEYGTLSMCPMIGVPDILSPDPAVYEDTLDFTGFPAFDPSLLSPGAQAMYAAGNLGGSSLKSEVLAYEVLYRCDGAEFLKGEGEIVYAIDGKKTDLLVDIGGQRVGVSVVRAESFPKGAPYPVDQAYNVLFGKLDDILQSTMNVAPEDNWEKQILAIMAQTPDHALAIQQAYGMVDAATKADTIVVITVTEGDDDFIYYN